MSSAERPRSPGYATDLGLLVLQGATVESRPDYLVVRTPANPAYHWGTCLILDQAPEPGSVASWVEAFRREHPTAEHVALGIDATEVAIDPAEAASAGVSLEQDVVLVTDQLDSAPVPDGFSLRELDPADPEQWAALVGMELEDLDEPDRTESHADFLTRRFAGHRALAEAGHGGWFAAYAPDGRPVASLGIFATGADRWRYQQVITHPDFRRRGIAGALLRAAGARAFASGARELVIVADLTGPAIGLYRRAGFRDAVPQWALYAPPA